MNEAQNDELMMQSGQWHIVHHVCQVIAASLQLQEAPVRGFFWRSLRDWQKHRHLPATAMSEMAPDERVRAAKEIGVFFKAKLTKSLGEAHAGRVEKAWDAALRTYIEDYSQRPTGAAVDGRGP